MTEPNGPPPLQFRLRSLLAAAVAMSVVFGTLRWLDVPPRASMIVLVILVVSVAAAVGLIVAIAGSDASDRDDRR